MCVVPSVFARLSAGTSLALLMIVGCNSSEPAFTANPPEAPVLAHAHPSEGPHHGRLIELGNEAYHAELVHDSAAGSITIYVLDSTAKKSVPIDAEELVVNLSHEGQAKQFKLAASPDSNDPAGKSSRFTSADGGLLEALDLGKAELVVRIDDKQFRGAIAPKLSHASHTE